MLPFALTGAMIAFDRTVRRAAGAVLPSGVVPRQIFLLAALSILTHPILDTLNTYGVRWLMPFRGEWFYGDTLFIVDPWLWLVLGLGWALSRPRRGSGGYVVVATRPARIALAVALAYIVAMGASAASARRIVREELAAAGGAPVERLMVGPRLATPLVRDVVAAQAGSYRVGTFHWFRRPHVDPASLRTYPRVPADDPAVREAGAFLLGRRFLGWARFPVVQAQTGPGGRRVVQLVDLRYAERPGAGFGTATIPVASRPASAPLPDTLAPSPSGAPASRSR